MAYDSGYYKDYYQKRKDEILAAIKEKYRTDKRDHEGILKRARVSSVIKTLSNQKQREAARVVHNGHTEKMYYLVHMEQMVNRDRAVLDGWRKSSPPIIPAALYFDKRGRGLYSESQIMYLSKVLHRLDHGSLSMTYNDLRILLHTVWKETIF